MTIDRSPSFEQDLSENTSIKRMADESLKLAPRFDRLALAVYQVLSNHRINDIERRRLFGEIMKDLRGRKKGQVKKPVEKPRPATSNVTPEMLRDARAHELRQPPDTYDPEAEELARKPFNGDT